ncbi:MAG TPA: SDR family oxidoreductase [Marmoricola sp.]|nr:SDR family oxidoreductase [Marmoricola sp.]HNJ78067.1 SDR family oxidoreductase [Marmoricola sp.]HNO40067.1 SDR family oxidoreductase [Marmoricola sp.]
MPRPDIQTLRKQAGNEPWRSVRGRTVVVTGANSGLGLSTTRRLVADGASVIMACRRVAPAHEVAASMAGAVRVEELDLASLDSIQAFAERITEPIDILINNAGVMQPPHYRETTDGFELMFGTNHFGHFALTGRLLPNLLATEHPRVVTVSSIAHQSADEQVLDANPSWTYTPYQAYARSKLANLLFATELHRHAVAHSSPLLSMAAHPGVAATGLVRDREGMGARWLARTVASPLLPLVFHGPREGAQPILYALAFGEGGGFYGPKQLFESTGLTGESRRSRYARDPALAAKLWRLSEERTGVTFSL